MRRRIAVGLAIGAAAAAAWWWAGFEAAGPAPMGAGPAPAAAPTATSPVAGEASPFGSGAGVAGAERPPEPNAAPYVPRHLDARQLDVLQALFAGHPQRDAKLARLLPALDHAVAAQRLRDASFDRISDAQALALAQEVIEGLDERVKRGELGLDDARALRSSALERIEADDVKRDSLLAEWSARQEREARPDGAAAQARRAELEVLAHWAADPRSPASALDLKRELEAAARRRP
jgi:hypothetical protein